MYHLTQFGVALPPGQVRVEAGTGAVMGHFVALRGAGSMIRWAQGRQGGEPHE
jgi:hypothetical protein